MEIFDYGSVIEKVAKGDKLAFEQLMEREQHRMLGILQNKFPYLDYEALFHDGMLKVWRKASMVDSSKPDQVSGWIFRVVMNAAIDEVRKFKRMEGVPKLLAQDITNDHMEDRLINQVYAVGEIGKLDSSDRGTALLIEKYNGDMSDGMIAEKNGIPLGTAKSLMHHSKKRAREILTYEK